MFLKPFDDCSQTSFILPKSSCQQEHVLFQVDFFSIELTLVSFDLSDLFPNFFQGLFLLFDGTQLKIDIFNLFKPLLDDLDNNGLLLV
jgi:hypothetical protein